MSLWHRGISYIPQTYCLIVGHRLTQLPNVTCPVEVYERLAAEVIMETLAAVLL